MIEDIYWDNDGYYKITNIDRKTIQIDASDIPGSNLLGLIVKIAEKFKVHPYQIQLMQDGKIIKYCKPRSVNLFDSDIKTVLTCIFKELPKLYICYKFTQLFDCYCWHSCGTGKFNISIMSSDDGNDPANECYVLTPEKCLHYIKLENREYPECNNNKGGFIKYEEFRVGLISNISNSDFVFDPLNLPLTYNYDKMCVPQILTYYDALGMLEIEL